MMTISFGNKMIVPEGCINSKLEDKADGRQVYLQKDGNGASQFSHGLSSSFDSPPHFSLLRIIISSIFPSKFREDNSCQAIKGCQISILPQAAYSFNLSVSAATLFSSAHSLCTRITII